MPILHNRLGDDIILDLLHRREDLLHQSADALDMKAGLVMAAAAFLAMQPAYLLTVSTLPQSTLYCQGASFGLLVVAVWFALLALRIGDYPASGMTEEWRDEQLAAWPDATEKDMYGTILWGAIQQAKDRVDTVCVIQEEKVEKLKAAQLFTVLALMGNIASILLAYITRRAG